MDSLSQDMLRKAKEIVKKILTLGYEAYLVGDSIKLIALDQSFTDLELYTSIPYEKLCALFSDYIIEELDNFQAKIKYEGYTYIITFPHDSFYQQKLIVKESNKHYSKNLFDYICTKDYTINSLVMNGNNIIYDAFSGKDDLVKKRIKTIYKNPKELYEIEPIKSLQLVKLVSQTGFLPENTIIKAIRKNVKRIRRLENDEVTFEILEILKGVNLKKALSVLYKTKIYKYIPMYRNSLEFILSGHIKEDIDTILAVSIVKEGEFFEVLTNYYETSSLRKLVKLALKNPKCNYSNLELFEYGMDICIKANRVNTYLKNAKKKEYLIKKRYNNLPIKTIKELKIDVETINSLDIEKRNELLEKVLSGAIKNEKEEIIKEFQAKKDNNTTFYKIENDKNYFKRTADYQTPENIEKIYAEKYDDSKEVETFTEIKKLQSEFEERLKDLELQVLERDLELEIEKKIRESNRINSIPFELRDEARKQLHSLYYDSLLETDKYKELRNKKTGDGNEND